MKKILCYGDSNTHGTKPMRAEKDVARFASLERWPGIVGAELGAEYQIIEKAFPDARLFTMMRLRVIIKTVKPIYCPASKAIGRSMLL